MSGATSPPITAAFRSLHASGYPSTGTCLSTPLWPVPALHQPSQPPTRGLLLIARTKSKSRDKVCEIPTCKPSKRCSSFPYHFNVLSGGLSDVLAPMQETWVFGQARLTNGSSPAASRSTASALRTKVPVPSPSLALAAGTDANAGEAPSRGCAPDQWAEVSRLRQQHVLFGWPTPIYSYLISE